MPPQSAQVGDVGGAEVVTSEVSVKVHERLSVAVAPLIDRHDSLKRVGLLQ
jgi:hypothetical protein